MFLLNQFPRSLLFSALFVTLSVTSGCASTGSGISALTNHVAMAPSSNYDVGGPAETEIVMDWSPESMFVLTRDEASATSLPQFQVNNISFTEVGVMDAVRLLASQAGLTVRVEGGAFGSERYGLFSIDNLSGSFVEVLDEMADAAGFFWQIKGRSLIIDQDSQFVVNLPPVLSEDTLVGTTNTIQALGARDTYLDRAGRTLVFTANRKGMTKIKHYLDNVRNTRSLLVYDTHIFQVDLSNGMNTGINWSQFGYAPNTTGLGGPIAAAGVPNPVNGVGLLDRVGDVIRTGSLTTVSGGIGLAVATSRFSIGSLVTFLNTQGMVKSLSSPQITMLSGSKGSLRVGKTVQFVSKVGSNTTTGVSQVTTETTSLRTGLALELQGDLYDKTVFTQVKLNIADIVSKDPFEAVGIKLLLPQTQDRDLGVSVRSVPGEVVLLGGIHIDIDNADTSRGLPGVSSNKSNTRSELVLVMKTRVINFVSKAAQKNSTSAMDLVPVAMFTVAPPVGASSLVQ